MNTIALTLGPIVETLSLGRKTSEIWAASYLFSSLMRDIIKEIKNQDGIEFLVPYVSDDSLFKLPNGGIGKFHDRFIFESDSLNLDDISHIINNQLDAYAKMMADAINQRDKKKHQAEDVALFLKSYIQSYMIEADTDDIDTIYKLLDSVELHIPYIEGENYLRLFLRRDVILKSKMAKDAFDKTPSFLSIPAIAAQESDNDDESQFEGFENAYRYIAIVYADGDNLGKALKAAGNVQKFSKQLFDFSAKASDTLQTWETQTLFVGGDDLLFFAPVLYKDGGTIFDLIDILSLKFKEVFGDVTTISFGVGITYYKYPLYEALKKSRDALFEKAKKCSGKNAVGIAVQKHSGQSFEFTIGKDSNAYKQFGTLLKNILSKKSELPHSVHHKLKGMKVLIKNLNSSDGLSNIFDNFFNEEIHQSRYKKGIEELRNLFIALGNDRQSQEKLFSMLSTIKLLRGDRKNDLGDKDDT